MFKLYLFYWQMRDIYNSLEDYESVNILDMARKIFAGYDRNEMLALRDAHLRAAKFIEENIG